MAKPTGGSLELEQSNGAHWIRLTRGANGTKVLAPIVVQETPIQAKKVCNWTCGRYQTVRGALARRPWKLDGDSLVLKEMQARRKPSRRHFAGAFICGTAHNTMGAMERPKRTFGRPSSYNEARHLETQVGGRL